MRVKALFVGLIPLLLTPLVLSETEQTTQQYLAQGNAHLAKGQFNDALVSFDAAIQKDPRNYLTYFRRAATYLSLGRVNAALDDFDIILELKPDFEQALIQRARLRAKEGMFASAIADLKKYTKLKPADTEAEELLNAVKVAQRKAGEAEKLIAFNDHTKALDILSSVIELASQNPKYRIMRAQCHLARGELEEAVGDFTKAAYLNPSDQSILVQLANLNYFALYEPAGALNNIKQCLHYDPEEKTCKALFRKVKKLEKAIAQVEADLDATKPTTASRKLVGTNDDGLVSQVESELKSWEATLPLRPPNQARKLAQKLYSLTCRAYSEQKSEHSADNTILWCGKVLKLEADDIDALTRRGDAYIKKELYDDAIRDLTRAQELSGGRDRNIHELLTKAQRLRKQASQRDYYKILGVPRDADKRQIKKAFRKLAHEWHPDKYSGDLTKEEVEKKMADINQAYEVLTDDEKRAQFDNGRDPYDPTGGSPFEQGGGHGGFGGYPFGGQGFPFFAQGGGPFGAGGQQYSFKMNFP